MSIKLIPRNEFRRRVPVNRVSGQPRIACVVDTFSSYTGQLPIRRVQLYPYPNQVYQIPYTYVSSILATDSTGANSLTSMSADTDIPKMPLRYRHSIIFHALSHWYRDRKDDARAEAAKAEYTDIMMRIVGDHDFATHTTAGIQPQIGSYLAAAKRPYSYRGGRKIYDLNDEFDSFKR